jgi:uncharacterized protein
MHRIIPVFAVMILLSLVSIKQSLAANPGTNIDCFNPQSSVESAICGSAELTNEAYQKVKSNPATFKHISKDMFEIFQSLLAIFNLQPLHELVYGSVLGIK